MLECLSALLVLFAGGGGSVLAAVQSKTVADPNLCPGYNSQLISPFLSSCLTCSKWLTLIMKFNICAKER
ncbi:hypothetical protein SCEN_K02400 [Saccharomyces cerevisiae]|nr:hypothetical protein SCEN_K02400 [Saccharomyces cerevisiae]